MQHHRLISLVLFSVCCSVCQSQPVFKVIPLGVKGGNDESNLSAYALAVSGTDAYVPVRYTMELSKPLPLSS
jgi:hypothetical protein